MNIPIQYNLEERLERELKYAREETERWNKKMEKWDKFTNVLIVLTLLLLQAVIWTSGMNVATQHAYDNGYNDGWNDAFNEGWEAGYDSGYDRGQTYAETDLYYTCEDIQTRSSYPDGFCQGVDMYLGI